MRAPRQPRRRDPQCRACRRRPCAPCGAGAGARLLQRPDRGARAARSGAMRVMRRWCCPRRRRRTRDRSRKSSRPGARSANFWAAPRNRARIRAAKYSLCRASPTRWTSGSPTGSSSSPARARASATPAPKRSHARARASCSFRAAPPISTLRSAKFPATRARADRDRRRSRARRRGASGWSTEVERDVGPIDVLVNSAGAARRYAPADLDAEAWHAAMDAKYFSYIHPLDAVLKRMVAARPRRDRQHRRQRRQGREPRASCPAARPTPR